MPKTGGSWLRRVLKRNGRRHRAWRLEVRQPPHLTAEDAPPGRPILGIRRNPWDWYVSWYFFRYRNWAEGTGVFSKEKRAAWEADSPLRAWDEVLGLPNPNSREGFLRALPQMVGDDTVLAHSYTITRRRFYPEDDARIELARFESLREDVEAFFARHSILVPHRLRGELRGSPKKNVSPRGPYQDYYDAAGRDLVAEADSATLERYGYRF
jgi:hypothetical protein